MKRITNNNFVNAVKMAGILWMIILMLLFVVDAKAQQCSGTPAPGNTLSSANPVCANDSITLSLQNPTVGAGVTYQWQESTDGITWIDINGATNATLTTPIEIPWEYKTCRVTCTNSGMMAISNPVHITLNSPSNCSCTGMPVPGNTLASSNPVCANDSITLSLQNPTIGAGVTYQWQQSSDGVNWTDISGATNATLTTNIWIPAEWKTCRVTCTNSGMTANSSPIQITLIPFFNCYSIPVNTDNCSNPDYITRVKFSNIDNSSGICLNASYSDYASDTIEVDLGKTYELTVEVNNNGPEYAGAWIDYNENAVFEASEFIALVDSDGVAPWIFKANVVLPVNATSGTTSMLVRSSGSNIITATGASSVYVSGEIERYSINKYKDDCNDTHVAFSVNQVANYCLNSTLVLGSSQPSTWLVYEIGENENCPDHEPNPIFVSNNSIVVINLTNPIFEKGKAYLIRRNVYYTTTFGDIITRHYVYCEHCITIANPQLFATVTHPTPCSGPNGIINYSTNGLDTIKSSPCPYNLYPPTNPCIVYTPQAGNVNLNTNIFPPGTYTLAATDANGCTVSVVRTVNPAPPQLPSPAFISVTQGCSNGYSTISYSFSGGTPPYHVVYNQPSPGITMTGTVLPGITYSPVANYNGVYTITICDANNCCVTTTKTVILPAINLYSSFDSVCRILNQPFNLNAQPAGGVFSCKINDVTDCPTCVDPVTGKFYPNQMPIGTLGGQSVDNYSWAYIYYKTSCRTAKIKIKVKNCIPPDTLPPGSGECCGSCAGATCPTGYSSGYNKVVNGNFQLGTFAWRTELHPDYEEKMVAGKPGKWYITKNASENGTESSYWNEFLLKPIYGACGSDAINDYFLLVNAPRQKTDFIKLIYRDSTSDERIIWSQKLQVKKGVKYNICFQANTNVKLLPSLNHKPSLKFCKGDTKLQEWPNVEDGNWNGHSCEWVSDVDGEVDFNLRIYDLKKFGILINGVWKNKDYIFGIDCIIITECIKDIVIDWAGPINSKDNSHGVLGKGQSAYLNAKVAPQFTNVSYAWAPGGDTTSTINISPDSTAAYTLTVSGANGIIGTSTYTVEVSPLARTVENVTSFGLNNGIITVEPYFGTAPYQYQWSNGSTIETTYNLAAGIYTVTVTDSNAVSVSDVIEVTQPDQMSYTATTNNTCEGLSTGSIYINSITGGTPPYSIVWNSGDSTMSLYAKTKGTYWPIISDALGYSITDSLVISDTTCTGLCDSASELGNIYFNDFDNNQSITSELTNSNGCAIGTYAITTNANLKCSTLDSLTNSANNSKKLMVIQGSAVPNKKVWSTSLNVIVGTNYHIEILVYPQLDSMQNNPHLGVKVDSFYINPGHEILDWPVYPDHQIMDWPVVLPSDFTADTSGFVEISIIQTNTGGAYAIGRISISTCKPVTLPTATCLVNPVCAGGVSDSLIVIPAGDFPPFEVYWEDGFIGNKRPGFAVGTYRYVVVDNLGAEVIDSVEVVLASPINFTNNVVNVLCQGQNNGIVSAVISGGVSPYNYIWSNGQTTSTVSGLVPGIYSVTATDANGCTSSNSALVIEPATLTSVKVITLVACRNSATAAINLTPTGGTPPYTYLWNNGSTTANRTTLNAGTYRVTITDANGCSKRDTIVITNPATLILNASKINVRCGANASGNITINPTGGVVPYYYLWNDGATTQTISFLAAGIYTCTVTDVVGCTKTKSISVTGNPAIVALININGPTVATVSASGGIPPFIYSWNTVPQKTTATATGLLPNHTYKAKVTDSKNCTKLISVTMPALRMINESFENEMNIDVFPNPAENIVSLQFENVTPGSNYKISFVNLLGEYVLKTNYKATATFGTLIVNTDQLSNGVYNVMIQNDGLQKSIMLVVH